jgi:hypothetical protein
MLRPFAITIAFALFMLLPIACKAEDNDYKPGAAWLAMSESSRFTWTFGATEGQTLIADELGPKSTLIKDNLLPSDKTDKLAKVITQYYRDAANIYIPWRYVAVVAAWKLTGRSETQINERLELLRQYSVWTREHRIR